MSISLIVPVDVAALCVGQADYEDQQNTEINPFALVAHNFSALPYLDENGDAVNTSASIASGVTPRPSPDSTARIRAGVHLHWALPDGLARGSSDGSGKVAFRVTPNRWLVVRVPGTPGAGALTGWIVESDYLGVPADPGLSRIVPVWDPPPPPAPGATVVPPAPAPQATAAAGPPYRPIGRAVPYPDWTEDQAAPGGPARYAPRGLRTAVGYGTPEHAASYSHAPNVFGFHDDLHGVGEDSQLAYAIVGWYSDPADDPLTAPDGGTDAEKVAAIRDRLGWIFEWSEGKPVPDRTICSGLVYGIRWDPQGHNIPQRKGKIDVAVGNTVAEAVAALVAHDAQEVSASELETLLECLQLGLLEQLKQPSGAADVDEARYQARFGSLPGGRIWAAKARDTAVAGHDAAANPASADLAMLDPAVADALNSLNDAQQEYDARTFEIRSRRERIFSDWCKFMALYYAGYSDSADLLGDRALACYRCRHDRRAHTGDGGGCTQCDCGGFQLARIGQQQALEFLWNPRDTPPAELTALRKLAAQHAADAAIETNRRALEQLLALGALCATPDCGHRLGEHGDPGHAGHCDHAGCACSRYAAPAACTACGHPAGEHLDPDHAGSCTHPGCGCNAFAAQRFTAAPADAPRYWQPNEPVVLLRGDLLQPPARYGGDGTAEPVCANCAHVHAHLTAGEPQPDQCTVRLCPCGTFELSGKLRCRLPDQLAGELQVGDAKVTAGELPGLGPPNGPLPAETGTLVAEAFIFDPGRAQMLAATLSATPEDTRTAQAQLLQTPRGSSPVGRNEQAKQPWIPILLQWIAGLRPMQPVGEATPNRGYDPKFLTGSYALDGSALELTAKAEVPDQPHAQSFSGTAILTARADVNLRAQLERYCQQHPDDPHAGELTTVAGNLRLDNTMTQTLTGFNRALLMQEQILQLPVGDPLQPDDDLTGTFHRAVREAVADANNVIPAPNWFYNPLRAGLLELESLTIVDAFGQRFTPELNVIPAQSLRAGAARPAQSLLPPRLAQPSRLLFRWLSAGNDDAEMNSHPAATPVFGWVLFNHLDESLEIFAADGTALGSFTKGQQHPAWQDAPGADAPVPVTNKHLSDFLAGVGGALSGLLDGLLAALEAATRNIHPGAQAEDAGLSLLIGQPFALVRASLRLELMGLPALEESWQAFDTAVASRNHDDRPCAAITKVDFPVVLGDLGSHDDGLLGWFSDDYRTFYSDAAPLGNENVRVPEPLKLTPVASTDPSPPRTLTLLLDPRGSVHASTGILPVKEISIPAQMYADAVGRLAATFLTAPLLTTFDPARPGGDQPGVPAPPLPREPGYAWSWVARSPHGWQKEDLAAQGTPAALTAPSGIVDGWLSLKAGGRNTDG